jgi:prophage antirepressor-like protein
MEQHMTAQGMTASALKTLTFVPGLDIRAIDRDGSTWFVARDALNALAINDATTSMAALDDEDKHRQSQGLRGLAPGSSP